MKSTKMMEDNLKNINIFIGAIFDKLIRIEMKRVQGFWLDVGENLF